MPESLQSRDKILTDEELDSWSGIYSRWRCCEDAVKR